MGGPCSNLSVGTSSTSRWTAVTRFLTGWFFFVGFLLPSWTSTVLTRPSSECSSLLTRRNQPGKDLVTAVQRPVLLVPADKLEQGPPEPREQPHQVGLAEVLPGRVQNLPGPQSSKP